MVLILGSDKMPHGYALCGGSWPRNSPLGNNTHALLKTAAVYYSCSKTPCCPAEGGYVSLSS